MGIVKDIEREFQPEIGDSNTHILGEIAPPVLTQSVASRGRVRRPAGKLG